MAAALHMPSPVHRPSMDRAPSLDQSRARSTPPFSSPYDHPPPQHSRPGSSASEASPYNQPYANSYFPQPPQGQGGYYPNQGWSPTGSGTGSGTYQQQYNQYAGQYPQGYQAQQQSQAEFAAWANAYQHMVVMAGQHTPSPSSDYPGDRSEGGKQQGGEYFNGGYGAQELQQPKQQQQQQGGAKGQPQAGFHPYKRGPTNVSLRDIPRSASMPSKTDPSPSSLPRSPSAPKGLDDGPYPISTPSTLHPPTVPSADPPANTAGTRSELDPSAASFVPPPRLNTELRRNSNASERSDRENSPVSRSSSPASRQPTTRAPTPLYPGPITNNTNARPSPLSNSTTVEEKQQQQQKGFKSRLFKGAEKEGKEGKKAGTPAKRQVAAQVFASPSESSTRSATPPITPPQSEPLSAPHAPFALNPAASSSELSLAETERTATIGGEDGKKGKRSMFRMKNMSTDNISLSSTVSSASMMIRKMGSIGKLARRNSLMGISRIFKDKPKDEDAALPSKEAKKIKKEKKKGKGKGDAAPASVSHATAEQDRLAEEEDDRTLAGLSPAAKLARQHTLKSRAEAQTRQQNGLPPLDNITEPGALPSFASVASAVPNGGPGPEVVHVQPRQTPTVVHAVAVTEHEYDSEDDTSDEGDTVEDLTMTMGRTRFSDEADAEFKATWGNAYIDKNAVPKKSILKSVSSYTSMEEAKGRPRSNSAQEGAQQTPGPLAQLPTADPARLDGMETLTASLDDAIYDPLSPSFSPFDQPAPNTSIYSIPSQNTSAPTLSLVGTSDRPVPQPRSMTVPAKRRLLWAPECAVYTTYDPSTYDRRSEPATCNRLTPELAMSIKQELNAFKLEMPVHPESRVYTHYFAW
ncbi:hypothetical protein IAR50_004378 [Cryptococcus sp. DSM 104548]